MKEGERGKHGNRSQERTSGTDARRGIAYGAEADVEVSPREDRGEGEVGSSAATDGPARGRSEGAAETPADRRAARSDRQRLYSDTDELEGSVPRGRQRPAARSGVRRRLLRRALERRSPL